LTLDSIDLLFTQKYIHHCQVYDTYCDTKKFELLKSNCWLKQREGKWSLKKVTQVEQTHIQYQEFNDEIAIKKEIAIILGLDSIHSIFSACPEIYAQFSLDRYEFVELGLWVDFAFFGSKACVVGTFHEKNETMDIQQEQYQLLKPVPSIVLVYLHVQAPKILKLVSSKLDWNYDICCYDGNLIRRLPQEEEEDDDDEEENPDIRLETGKLEVDNLFSNVNK